MYIVITHFLFISVLDQPERRGCWPEHYCLLPELYQLHSIIYKHSLLGCRCTGCIAHPGTDASPEICLASHLAVGIKDLHYQGQPAASCQLFSAVSHHCALPLCSLCVLTCASISASANACHTALLAVVSWSSLKMGVSATVW